MASNDDSQMEEINAYSPSPQPETVKRPFSPLRAWGLHLVAIVVLSMFAVKIVPEFRRYFEQFDLDLPVVTVGIITLSGLAVRYWYLVFPIIILIDGLLIAAVSQLPESASWVRTLWVKGFFWGVGLLLLLGVLALVLPYIDLIRSL